MSNETSKPPEIKQRPDHIRGLLRRDAIPTGLMWLIGGLPINTEPALLSHAMLRVGTAVAFSTGHQTLQAGVIARG